MNERRQQVRKVIRGYIDEVKQSEMVESVESFNEISSANVPMFNIYPIPGASKKG